MGSIVVGLILPLAPVATFADVEFPTQLVLQVHGATKEDVSSGQQYASCMRAPWLPTADQFEIKAKACSNAKASRSSNLKRIMQWVDHIAFQFPGREIDLRISRE